MRSRSALLLINVAAGAFEMDVRRKFLHREERHMLRGGSRQLFPKRHFVYSFRVEDELPQYAGLPAATRRSAERNIVNVIYESFVVTADHDYLTARLLALEGLYRGFFWAASQAIEKYLKAYLLLHGNSVSDRASRSHAVRGMFRRASGIDATLSSVNIEPHNDVRVPDGVQSFVRRFSIDEFLREIDKYGGPHSRYSAFGTHYETGHLFALDHFVFELRARIGVPSMWVGLTKAGEDALRRLETNNPWFARSPSHLGGDVPAVTISSTVTALEFLLAQRSTVPYRLALNWLDRKMLLPSEVKAVLEHV